MPRQTVQTQIRLLLKKQSDQGRPNLLFCQHFVNSSHDDQHFSRKKKKKNVQNVRIFKIANTFSNKIFVFRAGFHKVLVSIANWEDPNQAASSEETV